MCGRVCVVWYGCVVLGGGWEDHGAIAKEIH